MYSYKFSQPQELPERFHQIDISTKSPIIQTDGLTDNELAEFGWYPVQLPEIPAGKQVLDYGKGVLVDGVVTYPDASFMDVILSTPYQPEQISRYAFFSLFTTEELVQIYTVAKSDILVEILLDKLKVAECVDLGNPEIIAGLTYIKTLNIINDGRMTQILNNMRGN